MSFQRGTRIVVALWVGAGIAACVLALLRTVSVGAPTATEIMFAVVFGSLMAASWVWPITLYTDGESGAVDLDEAFFVLLVLLIPAAFTVLVFAFVTIATQAIKRRPLLKSAFNVGQVVSSVGLGALVFALLHGAQAPDGYAKVGAALAGALTYLVVNTGATVSIMLTRGTPWRRTILGGLEGGSSCPRAVSASPSPSGCC